MAELAGALTPFIPFAVLLSIRTGVILALLPAPFGDLAPSQVRAGLGLLIAACLTVAQGESAAELSQAAPLALLGPAVGELLVGTVIGLTARVTLAAAEVAGNLVGMSAGLGFAHTVDPTFGESALPTTRLLSSLGAVIFLALQGHHVVFAALAASVHMAPPGHAFSAVAHEGAVELGSTLLAHGLRVAAPVVATMFIVQLGAALVSRAAPRVHLFSLTFALAVSAGMLTLFVSAPSIATAVGVEVQHLPEALRHALGAR